MWTWTFLICHVSSTKLNVTMTNKYLPPTQLKLKNLSPNLPVQGTTTLFKPQLNLKTMRTRHQLGEECNLNIKNLPETFPINSTPIQISSPRMPTSTLDMITLKSKPVAVKREKANYSNSANILTKLFGEVEFVKKYDFLRKQAKNSNTNFNIDNLKTHSKSVLQHLKNLQNTLKIKSKTLKENLSSRKMNLIDKFYPDECSSKIQYTDTLKKLKYITTTQRLITNEKSLAIELHPEFAIIIFCQIFQVFLIIICRLLKY